MTRTTQRRAAGSDFFELYRPSESGNAPKYQQLRFALIEAIRAGHWRDGTKLPTEEELVGVTKFSLGTVQRALRMLAEDGIVVRRQGNGTFISHSGSRICEPWHFQFLSEDGESRAPGVSKSGGAGENQSARAMVTLSGTEAGADPTHRPQHQRQ